MQCDTFSDQMKKYLLEHGGTTAPINSECEQDRHHDSPTSMGEGHSKSSPLAEKLPMAGDC